MSTRQNRATCALSFREKMLIAGDGMIKSGQWKAELDEVLSDPSKTQVEKDNEKIAIGSLAHPGWTRRSVPVFVSRDFSLLARHAWQQYDKSTIDMMTFNNLFDGNFTMVFDPSNVDRTTEPSAGTLVAVSLMTIEHMAVITEWWDNGKELRAVSHAQDSTTTIELPKDEMPFSGGEILITAILMTQKIAVHQRGNHFTRQARRAIERKIGAPVPEIVIIDLPIRVRKHNEDEASVAVDWSHRWISRGHWGYRYGKLTWISPSIKGPADKPLVIKKTVGLA